VLEGTSLQVANKEMVNPLRFWHLVECINLKNGQKNVQHNSPKNGSRLSSH
jgi:phosphatidylethanolamine/phosphatidyl-N-methylethanolamine N-methyltransferase